MERALQTGGARISLQGTDDPGGLSELALDESVTIPPGRKYALPELCHQTTDKETILPPISGPVSLKPIPATWYTFFEAPESCRETVVPGDLERLDDHPPPGP